MNPTLSHSALILLGHGSTLNSDSSAPTYQHAEALRKKGIFSQVATGFWKEEPNFRQTLRQVDAEDVYIVPNFISSGYFTEQVIPRELALTGPITRIANQNFYYCPPVGLHIAMEEALLQRARSVVAQSGAPLPHPEKTACLFICGHGTNFNDNSTKIIYERAQSIKARGLYADCQPVLMEQKPYVKNWATLTDCADVIVVPFFIADGLHSYDDIPVLLGVTPNMREQGFTNPHPFSGPPARRLWYASAIGTEPFLTEVILQQIEQFQKQHLSEEMVSPCYQSKVGNEENREANELQNEALAMWLNSTMGLAKIGQVQIKRSPIDQGFEIRHEADVEKAVGELKSVENETELRQIINWNPEGEFRPFHAALSLQTGWVWTNLSLTELRMALDYLYPAAVSNWFLHSKGELRVTDWKETAERQSGRFKIVRELSIQQAREVVREHCHVRCGKTRLWSPAAELALASPHGDSGRQQMTLWCPEACNPFVGKAREKLKGPEAE